MRISSRQIGAVNYILIDKDTGKEIPLVAEADDTEGWYYQYKHKRIFKEVDGVEVEDLYLDRVDGKIVCVKKFGNIQIKKIRHPELN